VNPTLGSRGHQRGGTQKQNGHGLKDISRHESPHDYFRLSRGLSYQTIGCQPYARKMPGPEFKIKNPK
jgi:hypothetical protein